MSDDSSESPTKIRWQAKADKCLAAIDAVRHDCSKLMAGQSAAVDEFTRLAKRSVSLHELEKVINEAEMYDIYEENEVYDRLVDYHIKTLESIKAIKRCFPVKSQGGLGAVRAAIWESLKQGTRFRELDELIGQLDLAERCEQAAKSSKNNQALTNLLTEIERNPGAVDEETVDDLKNKKRVLDVASQKLKQLKKIEYLRDIDGDTIRQVIADIRPFDVDGKKLVELESMAKIADSVKKLYTYIVSEELMHTSLDQYMQQITAKSDQLFRLLKSNKEAFMNEFDEYSETCCREICMLLPEHVKQCDIIDDHLLLTFSSSLLEFLWKSHASRLLMKNEEKETILEDCIKKAPETKSDEYAAINERLHCIKTAKVTESLIKDKLKAFWSLTVRQLLGDSKAVLAFVDESRTFFNDKFVEKQIEHLEDILSLFSESAIDLDRLSKLTREFEDYNCGYPLLDEIKSLNSAVDLAKMYKEKVDYTWKRHGKAVSSTSGSRSLRDIQMVPRIDSKKAAEILKAFRKLDPKAIDQFADCIAKVEAALSYGHEFAKLCAEFESRYSRATLLSLECTRPMIEGAFTAFENLLGQYMVSQVKDSSLELQLEQNELFLKAQCLLKNIAYPDLRRDISSWETVLQKVKKYGQLSRDIVAVMESKMKVAEKLLMEAHKMRQFEAQSGSGGQESQRNQAKMLTADAVKEILRNYEVGESEVELQDTMSYLEKVVSYHDEYKEAVKRSASLRSIEELLLSTQKLPLLVDEEVYSQFTKIMKKPKELEESFLHALKTDPTEVTKHIAEWRSKFEDSPLKVDAWTEFLQAYKEEQNFENLLSKMVWENCSMEEVDDMKAKYQQHKFIKNGGIEAKLLSAEIGAIQGVYERRLFGEEKPGKLFSLQDLHTLLDRCQEVCRHGEIVSNDMAKRLSFIRKFLSDINNFTEDRIKTSSTLEELNLNAERNPFGDMVDLSEAIEVQKAKLSKEALKYGPGSVKVRQSLVNAIKQLLEKNPTLQSPVIDFGAAAKGIEKAVYDRCLNRAKNYEDYSRTLLKIVQRLADFTAITSYLKEKNFDLNLIEKLFSKSKVEFQTLEDNIVIKNKDQENGPNGANDNTIFNYYKIFQGTLFFGLKDNKTQKRVESAELFTCSPVSVIKHFSVVPNKLLLSMNIKAEEFQKYLQRSLLNDNYVVMACWVRFPQDSSSQARLYMEKNEVVASSQYCKSCKIFILPKKYIKPDWLKAIDFYTAREDNEPIDFVCFKVFKKEVTTEFEPPINPVTMPFKENCTFYQVYSLQNNILDRIVDPALLLQDPKKHKRPEKPAEENSISCEEQDLVIHNEYDDFFNSEDDLEEDPNNLVVDEQLEDNVWESQSNEWGARKKVYPGQPNLLNMLQPDTDAEYRQQAYRPSGAVMDGQRDFAAQDYQYQAGDTLVQGPYGYYPQRADDNSNLSKRPPKTVIHPMANLQQRGMPASNEQNYYYGGGGQQKPYYGNMDEEPTQRYGGHPADQRYPGGQAVYGHGHSKVTTQQANYYGFDQSGRFQRPQQPHIADKVKGKVSKKEVNRRNQQSAAARQPYCSNKRTTDDSGGNHQSGYYEETGQYYSGQQTETTYNLNYNIQVAGYRREDQFDQSRGGGGTFGQRQTVGARFGQPHHQQPQR